MESIHLHHNRERLFDAGMAGKLFERVKLLAEWRDLISDEYFSVEGTLIVAWVLRKSFRPKDEPRTHPLRGGTRRRGPL